MLFGGLAWRPSAWFSPVGHAHRSSGVVVLCFITFISSATAVTSFASSISSPSSHAPFRGCRCSGSRTRGAGVFVGLRGAGQPDTSNDGPIDTIAGTDAMSWDDRIGLQQKWTNAEKGWKVAVEWKPTPYGAGLFAAEDIGAGTVLRVGRKGMNLLHFKTAEDVEEFCKAGTSGGKEEDIVYRSRVGYAKDYLWGFYAKSDERGYPDDGDTVPEIWMWLPGNGLNHNLEPNTVYRPSEEGAAAGVNLVALSDVKCGEELVDDYRRHGQAPQWVREWASERGVTLNFADCNDFVLPQDG